MINTCCYEILQWNQLVLEETLLTVSSVLTEFAPEHWAAVHPTVLTDSVSAPAPRLLSALAPVLKYSSETSYHNTRLYVLAGRGGRAILCRDVS